MRVLIACEWSGRVRDAFQRRGHSAFSCDLQATKGEYRKYHIQKDVREVIGDGRDWDMMLAFPPCTYLTKAGNTHYASQRREGQIEAIAFVEYLWNAPVNAIAIENPIGVLSTQFRKPAQYVQPYWFGDPYTKKTCLWIKNLPLLVPTEWRRAEAIPWVESKNSRGHRDPKMRGITFEGMAKAMAEQWGHD